MRRLFLGLMLAGGVAMQCLAAEDAPATDAEAQAINPRYMLMDPRGRGVSNEDFPGRYQLIAFGYTFCPDVCPTTLAAMSEVLRRLGDKASGVQPIFITVDPERDTRAVMTQYTAYFDSRIIGLTGPVELVRAAADHYKVTYRKYLPPGAPPDRYSVDHSAGMTLLGRDGEFVAKFAHGTPPQEVAAKIAALMASGDKAP